MKRLICAVVALLATMVVVGVTPASAANCSSYPFILTNGQTADATQVMANLNNILSCGNNNLAKNGANSDITSLSGLTTPLSAAQGGTAQATSIFSSNNTWGGVQSIGASTTAGALLNLAPGVAPTAPSNGDLWTTSSGLYARINGATLLATPTTVLQVANQQAAGVNNPETVNTVGWNNTRTLNTVVLNTISGASLASNQITLPAGTYEVQVYTQIYYGSSSTSLFKHRLYNVTDASVTLYSQVGTIPGNVDGNTQVGNAPFTGSFTLTGTKVLRLDTYAGNGPTTTAGTATGDGSPEVYTTVYLRKIG